MATMATNPYLETKFNSPQPLKRSHSMDIVPLRRITAVKQNQIYNPQLPSLRRIEMDHILGKLPYEHCRASTWLSKEHFDRPRVKVFEDRQFNKRVFRGHSAFPERPQPNTVTFAPSLGQEMRPSTTSRAEIARAELAILASKQESFSKYLTANVNMNPPKEPPILKPEHIFPVKVPVVYLHPKINVKVPPPLRYAQTFKPVPNIDNLGQMPVPAKCLDKHREYPNHHRDISNSAWK